MTRTLVTMLLLAHSLLLPAGCAAWWNAKGKAEVTSVARCVEADVSSQVTVLISRLLAGDLSVLATVGLDILECAEAALVQMPSSPAGQTMPPGPGVVSRRDAALVAVRAERARRKAVPT